jgi:hypothetical protein
LKGSSANRTHHLVKTFWGWRDQQLPDCTVILNSPAGKTYVTTPGSALLFPSLCLPTGNLAGHETDSQIEYCGDRNAMMPRRSGTCRQPGADRVVAERRRNHVARTTRQTSSFSCLGPAPRDADDEPPPF